MRKLERSDFSKAYQDTILSMPFFEVPDYYVRSKNRYFETLSCICSLDLPQKAEILEIGGGQMALLMHRLFGDACTIGDVYDTFEAEIKSRHVDFRVMDLYRDENLGAKKYDLIILCEVIEHIPVPPDQILGKLKAILNPEGQIFLTTPNLYRLRNVLRLALGKRVFDYFYYPEPGQSLGHPLEYSLDHLCWHLERARLKIEKAELRQLSALGHSAFATTARLLLYPLLTLRPIWRDNLLIVARNSI
jgi:SAM-dependent methyltransferase